MSLIIENRPKISSFVGDRLDNVLQEVIDFSRKYHCECELEFNGTTHIINSFTDIETATKYWYIK